MTSQEYAAKLSLELGLPVSPRAVERAHEDMLLRGRGWLVGGRYAPPEAITMAGGRPICVSMGGVITELFLP